LTSVADLRHRRTPAKVNPQKLPQFGQNLHLNTPFWLDNWHSKG
jgi:hypothetical protein